MLGLVVMLKAIDIPPSSLVMTAPGTALPPCLVLEEDLVLVDVSLLLFWFPLVFALVRGGQGCGSLLWNDGGRRGRFLYSSVNS